VDQQQQSRWRPTGRQLLWAGGIAAVLTVSILIGYRFCITVWDWIKLLIVPAVIAGGDLLVQHAGHNSAPLVDYQASLNLYRHVRAVPQKNLHPLVGS
jgi:hypothetical protein